MVEGKEEERSGGVAPGAIGLLQRIALRDVTVSVPAPITPLPRVSRLTGWVYVIQAEGLMRCKVGWGLRPQERLRALQTGSPVRLSLWVAYGFPKATVIEAAVHRRLAEHRCWGEWFEVSAFYAGVAIREVAYELGIDAVLWIEPPSRRIMPPPIVRPQPRPDGVERAQRAKELRQRSYGARGYPL